MRFKRKCQTPGFMYAQREVLNRLEAQKKGAAEGAQ